LYNDHEYLERKATTMLVGICGKAGAGKDTIGNYLVEKYGFERIALADPIKRLVKDVFVLDDHTVYDRNARELPLEQWNGWTVRKLLQYIGTELFRDHIDDKIWVKSLWYRIKDSKDNYVISDLRFRNELEFFKDNAGKNFISIKVIRPGHDGNVGIPGHASEAYDLETEFKVYNDTTFEALYSQIDEIMSGKQISKKDVQKHGCFDILAKWFLS